MLLRLLVAFVLAAFALGDAPAASVQAGAPSRSVVSRENRFTIVAAEEESVAARQPQARGPLQMCGASGNCRGKVLRIEQASLQDGGGSMPDHLRGV